MGSIDQADRESPFTRGRLFTTVREGLQSKLFRNIVTLATGTAGAQAITMAFMPIITRLYGPEAYGVVGTFIGLTMVLIPLAALSYPTAIALPKRDGDARSLGRLSLIIAAGLSSLVALVLLAFGDEIAATLSIELVAPYMLLLPVVMFAGAALEVLQKWLYRTGHFRLTARMAVMHSFLFNGGRALGGLVSASATMLVITTALGQALHTLLLALGMRRTQGAGGGQGDDHAPSATDRELARRYRDFPIFRAPQTLINAASAHMPTLVLAASFGPAAAGFFALCRQAVGMPTTLIGKSVADVYYPRLARAIQVHEPITGLLLKGTGALLLVGLLPFGLVIIAGPALFSWVFGPEWVVAGEFARWLAVAELAVLVSRPSTVAVPALGLQAHSLVFEIISASLRVAALLVGALVLKEALYAVIAYAFANILIYLSLIIWMQIAARRWYARHKGQPYETSDL
ncbi:lipopolysaccharide biosynthesis protein [Stutzerimonas tarimensis]|uniref:Lipopolysaccharide biosynthesis protein n=1 Tax=Stutzerimonas tarimensis TaxID=1507735 RepID=A0ABV7T632_9GAMM